MAGTPQWRSRPVFITSTFRDMQAERDHLRDFVFPVLQERLRARFHHLEPIDLRLGVETISVDQEHARELLVLKVCLNEIERSRPFLIALIGDRYGWTPPGERMQTHLNGPPGALPNREPGWRAIPHSSRERRRLSESRRNGDPHHG